MKNSKKQQQQVEETKENKEEPFETKAPATTTTTSKKTTARKRAATSRRRPSIILCNTSVSSSSSTSTSTIRRPIAQNVPEPKITSSNNTNHVVAHKQAKLSLSVSAATKSCSNIQKSSVLADVAAVSEASKPPSTTTTTFPNPIGDGVSLSQFYLRYAPKNSFYSTTASIRSCHRKLGPSNPMPELTWASSSALWSAMKDKEQNYLRDAAYLKRHPGI
jgi:hypothetical protein